MLETDTNSNSAVCDKLSDSVDPVERFSGNSTIRLRSVSAGWH
jgi:hypothetical protein